MKKDRLYDILETMKKNQLKAVLSHFGALSDHSGTDRWIDQPTQMYSDVLIYSSNSAAFPVPLRAVL